MLPKWIVLTVVFVLGASTAYQDRIPSGPNEPEPSSRVNTTSNLKHLRGEISSQQIDALIVTTDDEHQSEFVAPSSKRVQFISGFTGSFGTAVITANKAVLWTDGRYHIQADNQIDGNWILMRAGLPKVPELEAWLRSEFPTGAKIGADPKLLPAVKWHTIEKNLRLENGKCELVGTDNNLIDKIWGNKPKEDIKEAFTLGETFTGESWQHKVQRARKELNNTGADAMIVTALDEVAWLLNIRGYDIPFSPVVNSYVILSNNEVVLFLEENKVPYNFNDVYKPAANEPEEHVRLSSYESIWSELPKYAQKFGKVLVPIGYGFNPGASKKIHDLVPQEKRLLAASPIINLKAIKNKIEITGMEISHLHDAVALCEFFEYLEKQLAELDEFKVAELVDMFRSHELTLFSPSFNTIAAFGQHSALPHYVASRETSISLANGSLLLIDSGGQYLTGTTDVTRTIAIGTPTDEHKEAYTRVLIGAIELSSLIFPSTLNTSQLDVVARSPLWELGYDYLHGTGHGVGSFLLVHESPTNIQHKSPRPTLLKPGYFTSIEPGFYLEGKFGVRLENVAQVVEKPDLKYNNGAEYLGFKDVTLVPYDIKLLDFNLLSNKHTKWLKEYYNRIFIEVGGELQRLGKCSTYDWLFNQLSHINKNLVYNCNGNANFRPQ